MFPFKNSSLGSLILFLGILVYLSHFLERDPSDPYSRPIISDAKGYYAYLPAIFIYQDFEYDFVSEMDENYYAVGQDKHIFIEVDGERVNKTFPGISLLYLPFFLIAHFLALLLGFDADGYSLIYQYLFDFGQFFYATLGMLFAAKFLEKLGLSKRSILLSIIMIVIGTNMWFYTVYDQSVTHIYNFFLISLFLYLLSFFDKGGGSKYLIGAIVTFAVLLIVRPTGMLSLLLIVFFFPKKEFYLKIYKSMSSVKTLILSILSGLIIICIPLVLWKAQSGNWIVYSYGEEGFNFTEPHILDFLFSYAKGWWLYSPMILLSILLGGYKLINKKEWNRIGTLVLFLTLSVYIFSSWWCWYYGFSFGQRPMVDFYIVFIYLLAISFETIQIRNLLMIGLIGVFFIFLNVHQSYQHYHGYYRTPTPTKEIYWDNFLSFKKKAKLYLSSKDILETYQFDFENELPEYSGNIVEHDEARSGKRMTFVDQDHPFSGNIDLTNTLLFDHPIVISVYVNAGNRINETCLVVEHREISDTYRVYPISEYVVEGEWIKMEFLYENEWENSNDNLHFFFWNKDTEERVYFDDVEVIVLN